MITREQIEKTTAEWEIQNPTLADNVIGVEIMSTGYLRYKRGNGVSAWKSLPYLDKIPPTEEAAKIATNFLDHTTANGLLIGDKTSGKFVGYRAQVLSDALNILDDSGNQIASFKKDGISLKPDLNMTGKIRGTTQGVSWYLGRDAATLIATGGTGASVYSPVIDTKCNTGDWSMGCLGDSLYFVFTTNANYNAGNNVASKFGIRNDGMPLLDGATPLIEYGTWTPVLQNLSGNNPSVSYNWNAGYYYRIGNMVFISADISPNISDAGGSFAFIAGLPYTAISMYSGLSMCEYYNVFNHGQSDWNIIARIEAGSTIIRFQSPTGSSALSWIANVGVSAYNPILRFSGWYRIA